MADKNEWTCKH